MKEGFRLNSFAFYISIANFFFLLLYLVNLHVSIAIAHRSMYTSIAKANTQFLSTNFQGHTDNLIDVIVFETGKEKNKSFFLIVDAHFSMGLLKKKMRERKRENNASSIIQCTIEKSKKSRWNFRRVTKIFHFIICSINYLSH